MIRFIFRGWLGITFGCLLPCTSMVLGGCEKRVAHEEAVEFAAGKEAQTAKDYAKALSHFQAHVAKHPKDAEAWLRIGKCYDELGEAGQALTAYQQSAKCEPEYVQAHVNLGSAYARAGRTAEAMASLREAIRIQPKDAMAHYNLGLLLSELGQAREAIEELEKAVQFKEDYAKPRARLVRLYSAQGNKEKVSFHCERLSNLDAELAARVCGPSLADTNAESRLIEEVRSWVSYGCPFNEGIILVAELNRTNSSTGQARGIFCDAIRTRLKMLSVAAPIPVWGDEDVQEEMVEEIESLGHLATEGRCSR